jgi:hypothetical protein
MNITQLDRTNLKLIRNQLEPLLTNLGNQLGVSLKLGNARFNPNMATFKLEVATIGANGTATRKEAEDYKALHSLYDLPADGLDKVVTISGNTYVILGLKPRRQRFPVLVRKQSTGKEYVMPADSVKTALAKLTPVA